MADEDLTQKFAELEAKVAAKEAETKAFADQLAAKDAETKQFAERVATLEDDKLTKQFTDWTQGRGGKTDGAKFYFTDVATTDWYVNLLKKLHRSQEFSDADVEQVRGLFAQMGNVVQQVQAGIFQPALGSDARGEGDGNAWGEIETEGAKLQSSEPGLSAAGARARILKSRPDLARKYHEQLHGKT